MSTVPPFAPVVSSDMLDAQVPLTQAERVTDTFFAPSKTFVDIRRNRSWWLPFVLLAAFSYLFSGVLQHRLSPSAIVDSALRANPKKYEEFKSLPAEQQATQRHFIQIATTTSLYTAPLLQLAVAAITALLLWGGFNFLLGGSSTFPAMFAVVMYAWLPGLLRALLSIVMLLVGDTENYNLQDPIGTNPGYYLSSSAAPSLHALLGSLDVFTLWILALLALGGAIVARVKISSGCALVFGAWAFYVVIKTGIAAAFG